MSICNKPISAACGLAAVLLCRGEAPLQYMSGSGQKAYPVVNLTWGLLAISAAVIAIITALLVGAIWHRPGLASAANSRREVIGSKGGLSWLWIGVGVSTVALVFAVGWTMVVLNRIEAPPTPPPYTIEVTGHQWWWEVHYDSPDPSRVFTTANEIHIPAGVPVRFRLIGADVIHSFWVPQLAGKTDMVPGQINETWLEAKQPGVYRGQCTEYCGLQHSHMSIVMVADTPATFRKWWDHQLQGPEVDTTGRAQVFENHCGGCHTVRGTDAAGSLGPDLSHLMTRSTIAAGTLPNDGPTLAHWISDPQSLKPGSLMPAPELTGEQLAQVETYLHSLK